MTRSNQHLAAVDDAPLAIELEAVSRHFDNGALRVQVLRDVSLGVEQGEWVAVMGPSGCGKTTLLHVIGGLDAVDSGVVRIDGKPMSEASETDRAKRRRGEISYVFQQYNLLSDLNAMQNVTLPLRMLGIRKRVAERTAMQMLERLGLGERSESFVTTLSGGEQQRVALARALVVEPVVLLADEPTGALDSAAGSLVLDVLKERHAAGQTIVMVTHDHAVASKADRVVTMADGRFTDEHRMGAVGLTDLPNLLRLEVD